MQKSSAATAVLPKTDCSNLHVLIVDDNDANRKALREQLTVWGLNVIEAASGEEALLKCQARVTHANHSIFDLAFIDMQMPVMSGKMLVRRIRENKAYQSMKLVMMTSMDEQSNTDDYTTMGINSSFPKPATTIDLFNAISIALNESDTIAHPISQSNNAIDIGDMKGKWPVATRVLLVEDNRVNQMVALSVLKNIGLSADIAKNGVEALACLESKAKSPYTVIIMDCQMPEMDGYEATKRIRNGDAGATFSAIPIIAMTANAMQGDKQKCIDAGMNDYLTKPIEPLAVLNMLKLWLT